MQHNVLINFDVNRVGCTLQDRLLIEEPCYESDSYSHPRTCSSLRSTFLILLGSCTNSWNTSCSCCQPLTLNVFFQNQEIQNGLCRSQDNNGVILFLGLPSICSAKLLSIPVYQHRRSPTPCCTTSLLSCPVVRWPYCTHSWAIGAPARHPIQHSHVITIAVVFSLRLTSKDDVFEALMYTALLHMM